MGRTIVPYSRQIDFIKQRISNYRRALRKQDQEILDELFINSKYQVQSGVMASNPNPMDSMFLSMMIELKKEMKEMQIEINRLKNQNRN